MTLKRAVEEKSSGYSLENLRKNLREILNPQTIVFEDFLCLNDFKQSRIAAKLIIDRPCSLNSHLREGLRVKGRLSSAEFVRRHDGTS